MVHVAGFADIHDLSRLPESLIGKGNGHEGAHPFLADDFVRAQADRASWAPVDPPALRAYLVSLPGTGCSSAHFW